MLSVIVRRSTRTMRSTTGISTNSPGPFGCGSSRPSRKTMPRSYSRATLIAAIKKRNTKNATTASATRAMFTGFSGLRRAYGALLDPMHVEGQPVERSDADTLARMQRLRRARTPQLASHEYLTVTANDAFHPHDLVRPDRRRLPPHGHRLRDPERPEPAEYRRDRHDERYRRVVRRGRLVEQRQQSHSDRDQARERERAVRRDVRVDHEQRGAEQHEHQARPREWEHREAEERAEHADRAERARDDDTRVEQLEAEPGEAGEEEEADDVRVDQRRQEPRQEARANVDDLRVLRVQREVARHRHVAMRLVQERGERGRDHVDHVLLQRLLRGEVRRFAHACVTN